MKRISIRLAALALLVFALVFVSSSTTTRTAKACVDLYGEIPYCGDPIFNDGIVFCYATVCEQ